MNLIIKSLSAIALLCFVSGCSSTVVQTQAKRTQVEHKVFKNYNLGSPIFANVGDPVIKIQDYWFETFDDTVVTLSGDLVVSWGGLGGPTNLFKRGVPYQLKGTAEVDGVSYSVVATYEFRDRKSGNPVNIGGAWTGLLVRDDGTILPTRIVHTASAGTQAYYTASVSDTAVTAKREKRYVVDSAKGYENYEFLYTGLNSSGLNFTYREFSPEGLARVAFFQNLTYPLGVSRINFKKFRIQVNSADAERVSLTIIEDGISDPTTVVSPKL